MVALKHDRKVMSGSLLLFCIHTFHIVALVIDKDHTAYSRNAQTQIKELFPKIFNKLINHMCKNI